MNALLLTLATVVVAPVALQGGYSTEKHPELGMDFPCPRDYVAVPVQPDEEWAVLYFVEKEAFRESDRKRFRPELRFLWIERGAEAPTATVGEPPPPDEGGGEESGDVGEGSEREGEEDESAPEPVVDFETWQKAVIPDWRIESRKPFEGKSGTSATEYELSPKRGDPELMVWACAFDTPERTIVMLGEALDDDFEEQRDIWRTMARKLEIYAAEPAELKELERYYSKRSYSNVEYRMSVRKKLVRGWKAEDTDNFIVVYSTKDEPLIRLIKSELEAIREEYVKLYPAVREVSTVSTVRICKDEAEYLKYGGFKGSGGYWNSAAEELVFFDYENVDGKAGTGKANSRVVLYHEAFHQYIHYAVGELPPHSWFNEGTGDYFSGASISGGKVKKIGVNPWRIELIQYALTVGGGQYRPIPFAEILRFEQPEFYQRDRIAVCYAQAWSMIYFLRTAKEVQKRPDWSGILDSYFETLKREYAAELEKLGEGEITDEEKYAAGKSAREKAVEHAFSDVDLRELERAWKEYTLTLKPPK